MEVPALDVWVTHAKRDANCGFCPEKVVMGSPELVTRSRRRMGGRTFTRVKMYHPECWMAQGMQYLDTHPYVPKLGRPRLNLSLEDRAARKKLLMQHGQYLYRYRKYMEEGRVVPAVEQYLKAVQLREEIEPLGGVPRSWYAPISVSLS